MPRASPGPAVSADSPELAALTVPKRSAYRRRYRRTLRFFAGLVASLVWWEIVLRRIIGRRAVARGRPRRLRRYARDFRALAVAMGGVMIKLGQFFSARVDVLPVEITQELAGLQDEVPPAAFETVRPVIEAELGPLEETFACLDREAHAAASLGQVYRGRLSTGDRVVIKVQRPGIRDLVDTDLAALGVVGGWVMRYRPVRRRANVPTLLDEFARTLHAELDYEAEANNARRLAEIFADDPGVYIPAVYEELSTARVLTLEDVTSIKITDHQRMDAEGVDRREAALRLFRSYMKQIFDHRFFHADPHPGNLFVYPLPAGSESEEARPSACRGRPFYLIFVDFGMVGRISDNVFDGLREALLALGTRDMRRLVKGYQLMGVLLPHADLDRLAQAEQMIFDRVWGMNMSQMAVMGYEEMRTFALEFRDLLYDMPFQVPQDLIYLGRATGILSGMCTSLHPEFNPWTALAPYAQRLVKEELQSAAGTWLAQIQGLLALPTMAETFFRQAERGELQLRVAPQTEMRRLYGRIELAIHQAAIAMVTVGLAGAGAILALNDERLLGIVGLGLSGLSLAAFLWRSLRRSR